MSAIPLFVTCVKDDQPMMQVTPGVFHCPKCQVRVHIKLVDTGESR